MPLRVENLHWRCVFSKTACANSISVDSRQRSALKVKRCRNWVLCRKTFSAGPLRWISMWAGSCVWPHCVGSSSCGGSSFKPVSPAGSPPWLLTLSHLSVGFHLFKADSKKGNRTFLHHHWKASLWRKTWKEIPPDRKSIDKIMVIKTDQEAFQFLYIWVVKCWEITAARNEYVFIVHCAHIFLLLLFKLIMSLL